MNDLLDDINHKEIVQVVNEHLPQCQWAHLHQLLLLGFEVYVGIAKIN